ncbi:MAG: hypothetical protein IJ802_04875 [Kiritimatiellae bacterium]|nr:hypothetical protein [Kiritimatiellia bacterium]
MRKFFWLAKVAMRQSLDEALSPVLFIGAYMLIHLLPAFHYHRFGEVARLARECGFSCLLTCGIWFSAAAAARIISSEIASGTAGGVIATGIGRCMFFLAKLSGVFAGLAVFAAGAFAACSLACVSSLEGAHLAAEGLQDTAVWGPGIAVGTGAAIVAFALAALANRNFGKPFKSTACAWLALSQVIAFAAVAPFAEGALEVARTLAMPWLVLSAACAVFAALGAAAAVWLAPQAAAGVVAAALFASFLYPLPAILPDMGTYWLSDAVPDGGVALHDAWPLLAAAACMAAFWLAIGIAGMRRKEIAG